MKRVLVIGCPGAGKSTVARVLAARTGLPLIHLDRHYWRAGWVRPNKAIWREKVLELAASPSWIMDGNYGSTLPERAQRADTIIHLDYPTGLCLFRVVKRMIFGGDRERNGELGSGCPERFDRAFLRFVLLYRRDFRPRDMASLESFTGRRLQFKRPCELSRFLEQL